MTLIGRQNELSKLERLYRSDRAEFLALYGRRRVGKTFLIKELFGNKSCNFLHVTGIKDGNTQEQIARFTKMKGDLFHKGSALKEAQSWFEAFDALNYDLSHHADSKKKIVFFLDEFPWMVTHKSKLLQAVDHFWNHYWSNDKRIKLVICGSSASWIIRNLINNKGGLHNRITQRILLKPFTLKEAREYLLHNKIRLNQWHMIQVYMATGGVPYYLSFIEKGKSSAQIIEALAFCENSPLLMEFDNLFSSLFEDEKPYIDLLRIIAKHRYGIAQTEIAKQSKSFAQGGHLTNKLEELREAGFIMEFKPFQRKKRGKYFRVIDEYTLFYLYWIEPVKNTLQEGSLEKGYWQTIQETPSWYSWSGYAFEGIVYKHISQVRSALEIPVTAMAHVWRYAPKANSQEDGAQIDLLFDRKDNCITLCEIKFTPRAFVIDKQYAAKLTQKQMVFEHKTRTKKQIFMAMIAACNMKNNPYSDVLISSIATLNDLFA